jgi:uncharacterized membrane protein YcaP (DUF421 family)
MKKDDIHLYDLQRILLGQVPPLFYIELIIRGLFVYALITFGIKYMGKRISAELTPSELAAIASLAAATGLVIMAPDRGLLPPVIVLVVMIAIKRFTDSRNYRSRKFERLTQGTNSALVKDGVLQTHEMVRTRISKEQLFAQLRQGSVIHLGMVKRLFIEVNGSFSLVKEKEKKAGMPVIPSWDTSFVSTLQRLSDMQICSNCGQPRVNHEQKCTNCDSTNWEHPVS